MHPELGAVPAAAADRPRAERRRRQGRAARPARPARPRLLGRPRRLAGPAARCSRPSCRCSSSTRTTSARRCCCACVAAGPPGAYNIAGDGVLTAADVAREFGLIPLPVPAGAAPGWRPAPSPRCRSCRPPRSGSRRPRHPAIMDTTKAKRELGWAPRYTALEALRDTLRPDPARR